MPTTQVVQRAHQQLKTAEDSLTTRIRAEVLSIQAAVSLLGQSIADLAEQANAGTISTGLLSMKIHNYGGYAIERADALGYVIDAYGCKSARMTGKGGYIRLAIVGAAAVKPHLDVLLTSLLRQIDTTSLRAAEDYADEQREQGVTGERLTVARRAFHRESIRGFGQLIGVRVQLAAEEFRMDPRVDQLLTAAHDTVGRVFAERFRIGRQQGRQQAT